MSSVQRIFPKNIPAAIGPYAPVTKIGDTVYVSGQIAIVPESGQIEAQDIKGQTHQVMVNLKNALLGAECTFSDVAKTTILLTDMANFAAVNEIYAQYFENQLYAARVCYAVKSLPKDGLIEIDAIAYKPTKGENKN